MEAKLEEYRLKKRRETHQMEGKDSTILQGQLNTNNNWRGGLSTSFFHREVFLSHILYSNTHTKLIFIYK